MKVNVLDSQHSIAESWHCHTYDHGDCFQKCGFNFNQSNDGEDATELSIAKDDWGQLKAGVSFQEYVSHDNNTVTSEV
jgi:hypothetical protein